MKLKRLAAVVFKVTLGIVISVVLLISALVLYVYNWESGPRITRQNEGTSLGVVDFALTGETWDGGNHLPHKVESLPVFDPNAQRIRQLSLIGRDLSALKVENRANDLLNANFDSRTVWPDVLPASFDPAEIIEIGKNPGLNIRKLHAQGITGKGIGIGIIDTQLRTDHVEYKDRLRLFEVISCKEPAQLHWHPTAVSSIALGKNVGVAPEADLYFIAVQIPEYFFGKLPIAHMKYIARAVERFIELNRTLPPENKIRAISISLQLFGNSILFREKDELRQALERAKQEGIFLISCDLENSYGFGLHTLERNPLSDPDNFGSYRHSHINFLPRYRGRLPTGLMVPVCSKSWAGPSSGDQYIFGRYGGISWAPPYLAGLYALACQVEPGITPELFWEKAIETGEIVETEIAGEKQVVDRVVNPVRLIESL